MLPWKLNLNGSEETTYNADISRALATLMPAGRLNRNRLNDDELKTWLADGVMTRIEEQWDVLWVAVPACARKSAELLHRSRPEDHPEESINVADLSGA